MKRMINAGRLFEPEYNIPVQLDDDDDEFIPPKMDETTVNDVCNQIETKCKEMYGRRFKNLFVEFDDVYWGSNDDVGGTMHATVTLYSNGVEKCSREFNYYTRDSYWEESDYIQDISRAVYEFVENLV